MANKKISELESRASLSLSDLMAVGDPSTGYLYKTTISDLKTLTGAGVVSFNGRFGTVNPAEGDYTLTQLGDVIITSPSNGQVLKYNGSNWVNATEVTEADTLATVTARGNVTTGDIAVNGKITIGTAFPGTGQRIEANAGAGSFDFVNSSGGGFYYRWIQNGATAMQLSTANNLLIGTVTDSGYKLDVAGSAYIGSNPNAVQLTINGALSASAGAFLQDALSFNGTNRIIYANGLSFTTNNSLSNLEATRYLFTQQTPSANSGTGVVDLVKILMPVNTGAGQNVTSRGLVIDFSVTTNGGSLVAIDAVQGTVRLRDLSGTGSRMVVADANGVLSTQAIPDLTGYVTLSTAQTITGEKIFTTGISAVGGIALRDTVGGSNYGGIIANSAFFQISAQGGSAILIKASDGTNALTIGTTGNTLMTNVTAASFIRSGGTSSQFLKADGSVDSNTYLTSASVSGVYLPLSGGTLTGGLIVSPASGAASITMNAPSGQLNEIVFKVNSTNVGWMYVNASYFQFNSSTSGGYLFKNTAGTNILAMTDAGAATFSSSVTAGGDVTLSGNESYLYFSSIYSVGSNTRAKIRTVGAGGGSGYGGDLRFSTRTSSNNWNEDAMVITSGGNVGIGSTTASGFTRTLKINTASGSAGILLADGDTDRAGFYIDAGTTAPAYLFTNDSKPLVLSVAGSEAMRITSGGQIGVGTTSGFNSISGTEKSIHIANSNVASLYLNSTGTGKKYILYSGATGSFVVYDGNAGAARMVIDTNGAATFSSSIDMGLNKVFSGGGYKMHYRNSTVNITYSGTSNWQINNDADNAALMTVLNGGNVGINTTNPLSRLHVEGSVRTVLASGAGGDTLFSAIAGASNGYRILVDTSNNITYTWSTGTNTTAMTITSAGRMGLGTSSPDAQLHVVGNQINAKTGNGGTYKQTVVGQTTAAASGSSKKLAYVSHTHSVRVYVWANQSTGNGSSAIADIVTLYGSSNGGTVMESNFGNVSDISITYDNGGSPGYTINVSLTYSGAAPTINFVIEGVSHDNNIYTL